MPSLESIRFDTSGLNADPKPTDRRVWYTPEGDGIVLYHFAKPPDLPGDLRSAEQLRHFYLRTVQDSPAKLVEAMLVTAAGRPAVRTIIKVPQQPTGMTYVGSLTIPFRDFSFIVKGQCPERGTTGVREAMLLDRMLREGTVTVDPKAGISGPWNPDNERYDAEFPTHPLSRLRVVMRRVEGTVVLDAATAAATPFPVPQASATGMPMGHSSSPPRQRWKFWQRGSQP